MSLLHEEDLTLSDDFFNDINPLEDIDTTNDEGDWFTKFQQLEPPPMDVLSSLSSEFTSCGVRDVGRVGNRKTVPILKQSSSSSPSDIIVSKLFQSSSPVSVLESSDGSFSPRNIISLRWTCPVKGLRSKRKRSTTLGFRYPLSYVPRRFEKLTPGESESETYYSSYAKKKRKFHPLTYTVSSSLEGSNSDGIVRKCSHCETTKTPQWREGPNGPKTLCNACGVRFRSGRLVPEYRPASSPTFIPSVHSNSHRKIIEMRRKDDNQFDKTMVHVVTSQA